MTQDQYARNVLLRLVANFPGLVNGTKVDSSEIAEWLSNEFHHMITMFADVELISYAKNGTPDGQHIADWSGTEPTA